MSQYNPYQAPSAHVDDVSDEMELAGRGTRLAAAIVDSLIMMAILLGLASFMAPGIFRGQEPSALRMLPVWLVTMLIWVGINYPLLAKNGQTIGKKLFGIRIVRGDRADCAAGRIIGLRFLIPSIISQIPILGPIFGFVNVLFIFRESRKCLHDSIADTLVVRA